MFVASRLQTYGIQTFAFIDFSKSLKGVLNKRCPWLTLPSAGYFQRDQTEMEWKQVSMVIDRFLLLIFFLAMTIASLVILTSSPHLTGAEVKIDKKNLHK